MQPTGAVVADGGIRAGEQRFHRVSQVVLRDFGLVPAVVDRPVIEQPPVTVEEEHLGRPLRAERARERLVGVVEVVEVEAFAAACRTIASNESCGYRVRIVRVDGDEPNAALGVLVAAMAIIRPSQASTYGQWLQDWIRTSSSASS